MAFKKKKNLEFVVNISKISTMPFETLPSNKFPS